MECDALATCPFFNDQMAEIPLAGELYKAAYCRGDFRACARYMVRQAYGPAQVPADLYPNEVEQAQAIISGLKP